MAQFHSPYGSAAPGAAQNLQFYPSTYSSTPVSGHTTPSQAFGGYASQSGSAAYPGVGGGGGFGASGFGAAPGGVSGRMGEQGGLRTGWLAAFGTEGYDAEPPLLEELGVNFSHIKGKVPYPFPQARSVPAGPSIGRRADLHADPDSSQSPCKSRSAHHGRFGPCGTHSLLPPLRNLSPLCPPAPVLAVFHSC